MTITPYKGRLGIVSTSRSGSTYFRRYLCNHYGVADSKSWLKHNNYNDIDNAEFVSTPHLLKILPHYILDEKVYQDIPCIWLYRKDVLSQFLSHITRLRTKVNHITEIKDRPDIPDNSLIATTNEIERFQLKQHEFWNLYKKYGEEEPLIAFEDFLDSPLNVIIKINNWAQWDMYKKEKTLYVYDSRKRDLKLTVALDIKYKDKFKNYKEIKGWFSE